MYANAKSTTPIVELITLINSQLSTLANDFLSCDFIIHIGHILFKILTKLNRFDHAYSPTFFMIRIIHNNHLIRDPSYWTLYSGIKA